MDQPGGIQQIQSTPVISIIVIIVTTLVAIFGTATASFIGASFVVAPALAALIQHHMNSKIYNQILNGSAFPQTAIAPFVGATLFIYGFQFVANFAAGKFICPNSLTSSSTLSHMAETAIVPTIAVALLLLFQIGFLANTNLRNIITDPLFAFFYIMAASSAGVLILLQRPCQVNTNTQSALTNNYIKKLQGSKPTGPTYQKVI